MIIKSSITHWSQQNFSIELHMTKHRTAYMMSWGFSRVHSGRTDAGTSRVIGLSVLLCGMLYPK